MCPYIHSIKKGIVIILNILNIEGPTKVITIFLLLAKSIGHVLRLK